MSKNSSFGTEQSVDASCLILESPGQTWLVPFDALRAIPRVGEKIRLAGGKRGQGRRSRV